MSRDQELHRKRRGAAEIKPMPSAGANRMLVGPSGMDRGDRIPGVFDSLPKAERVLGL